MLELSFQNSLSRNQLSHVDSFCRLIPYIGRTYFPELFMSCCSIFRLCTAERFDRSRVHLEIYQIQMRFTIFRMEIEEDNRIPGDMNLLLFPVRCGLPSSNNYNSFGGVRHGFSSGSYRISPYHPVLVSNSAEHPYRLPPMRSVPSDHCLDNGVPVSKLLSSF
jgi:hypothetical protein